MNLWNMLQIITKTVLSYGLIVYLLPNFNINTNIIVYFNIIWNILNVYFHQILMGLFIYKHFFTTVC